MSKLAALFGVPTTTVGAFATAGVLSSTTAGVIATVIGSVQLAVWAFFSPSVPWFAATPPDN
jgi:hypothetical protein